MGKLRLVSRAGCVVAMLCGSATIARAGSVTLTNGVTGVGTTSVSPDDFGTYGFLIGQQYDDEFHPAGVANPFTPTYLTGVELFLTTPGNATSSVLLTEYRFWHDFVENPPPTPDGISGPLARTVTTAITASGNQATSAFRIADTASQGITLDFSLVQSLTSDAAAVTSQVDQVYTITNNGTAVVDVVFHLAWDPDLYFNPSNQETDDIVGVGPGLCGPYMHDGDPRWSVALGNGPLSTVPLLYYYAGKQGFVPGTGPAFVPISAAIGEQWIWIDHGMPDQWRNYVVGPGVGAVGESDPALIADATLGSEYRFSMAVAATEVIHIRRYYGTTVIPCFGGPIPTTCGNGVVDADKGELCDGDDTATCNGATCSASACGDNYPNAAAGEDCDSAGIDSPTCNATTCKTSACGDGYFNSAAGELCDDGGDSVTCNANCTPAACGDGYVNVHAAEDCEGGELCDMATCTYSFSLGGGCGGCGTSGDAAGAGLLVVVCGMLIVRRRRPGKRPD